MDNNKPDDILLKLNWLLTEELSLHTVSFEFDKLAQDITSLGLSFKVVPVIEYYLDDELTFARNKQMQATKIGDMITAFKFRDREKMLLAEKAGTEVAILRREPSLFTLSDKLITAYLGCEEKERLLKNLIDGYGLKTK